MLLPVHMRSFCRAPPRLAAAAADAMLLVDVDFAVSQSLADLVRGEATYKRLMSMLHNRQAPRGLSFSPMPRCDSCFASPDHGLPAWPCPGPA